VGEYIEVVDSDPASGTFYKPVSLNDPRILAQGGLPPSESNPQFHQQMVYAVAMATIRHFEQALGRVALWSSHAQGTGQSKKAFFVRRLRIYPHAIRDRNAFYSPEKKALLFGYFPVDIKDANNTPGTIVFTCLSHDIVAHETTHALLDGVHPHFNDPVNGDVLAFHEAFADIVALFQHFSYPGVLRDQISRTRGDLTNESLLGQLAQQFGRASGRGHALRDALGEDDDDGKWKPRTPDVHALDKATEPHERGAILVAAVFGAFLKVYRARTADLFRIASDGTGILRKGDIHPDLSNRLASEAASTAQSFLQMCIRAIDYCPPIGITFGTYLRALVTGDKELNPDDSLGYRLAIVESFRQWGIQVEHTTSMSVESLLWPTLENVPDAKPLTITKEDLATLFTSKSDVTDAESQESSYQPDSKETMSFTRWDLESDRFQTWKNVQINAVVLWKWLVKGQGKALAERVGIVIDEIHEGNPAPRTITRSPSLPGTLSVEVHSVRTALRRSARGAIVPDIIVEIMQRRRGYFDADKQKAMDAGASIDDAKPDFWFRTGCTLVLNPETKEVRRVIKTPGNILDDERLRLLRRFLVDGGLEPVDAFEKPKPERSEPFALLHRED
jgi:hypothetical protein